MESILKTDKFEELLIANWTQFLDSSRFMRYCLKNVRDRINEFPITISPNIRQSGVRITISRFEIVSNGFIVWVEFSVPSDLDRIASGTIELHMSNTGDISHIQTLGNLYTTSNLLTDSPV